MNGMAHVLPLPAVSAPAVRLAELFDTHYERLYGLARRLAPSADHAQDLVQETFLRAARSLPSIPSSVAREEAWLVRVLVNIRRDEWRKEAVRNRHLAAAHADDVRHDNEEALVARTTVWRALDTLTPRRRAVVVMHEIEGLTIAAVASLLGISAITA